MKWLMWILYLEYENYIIIEISIILYKNMKEGLKSIYVLCLIKWTEVFCLNTSSFIECYQSNFELQ